MAFLEGFFSWLLTLRGLVITLVFLAITITALLVWDTTFTPVILSSLKSFATKTVPKIVGKAITFLFPLLAFVFKKRFVRVAFASLLSRVLTPAEKEQVKNSKEVAVAIAKHYVYDRPAAWWQHQSKTQQTILVSTVLVGIVLLALGTYIGWWEAAAYIAILFWKSIVRGLLWLIRLVAPGFGFNLIVDYFNERVLPYWWRLIPGWIKHSRFILWLDEKHFITIEKLKRATDNRNLATRAWFKKWRKRQEEKKRLKDEKELEQDAAEEAD